MSFPLNLRWISKSVAAAALVAASALPQVASAQGVKSIKLAAAYEAPEAVKKMREAAKRLASTRDPSLPGSNYAKPFFQTYVPAKMTQDSRHIAELMPEVRAHYALANRSTGSPSHRSMAGWIYRGMKPVAVGDYSPAARMNAILMIAQLDEQPADRASGRGPIPLRYILTDLLPLYENTKNVDGVRAAALQGLRRYCTYAPQGVTGANLDKIKTLMNSLLTDEAPEGRDKAAHAVLQRYAVDILTSLNADANLGTQLISISTEPKNHDLIALHSVGQIGLIGNVLKGKVDSTDDVLNNWTVRAMRSFQYELLRLKAMDRPKPATQPPGPETRVGAKKTEPTNTPTGTGTSMLGGGGRMDAGPGGEEMQSMESMGMDMDEGMQQMGMDMEEGSGGMAPTARSPQPPEVMISRRKLNYVLQQLHYGATGSKEQGVPKSPAGLMVAVNEEDSDKVKTWVESMEEVLTALNEPSIGKRLAYIDALEEQIEKLKEIAGEEAVKAAEEEAPLEVAGVPAAVAEAVEASEAAPGPDPELDSEGVPNFPENTDELSFD